MCAAEEAAAVMPAPVEERPRLSERLSARLTAVPWLAPLAVLGCFAAAAGGVVAINPTDDTGPTTCLFKMVTGFDCPGCGGTRAFYYAVTLNLPEAARNHAIALFAAPFIVWMYLTWLVPTLIPQRLQRKVRWKLPRFHLTPQALTLFLIAWAAFWVVRNLPWEPFTYLYV